MKTENEADTELSSSDEKLERTKTGVGGRIRHIRGRRSQAEFGERYGITLKSIARWEREESDPNASFLAALVANEKVDGTWLLTGLGASHGAAPSQGPALDREEMLLLLDCYVAVEGILSKNGRHATHEQKRDVAIKMLAEAKQLGLSDAASPPERAVLEASETRT